MTELKHPYYIVSPDYKESSGGIQALHKLCHRINSQGGAAWMVDGHVINPKWNTPVLNMETFRQHRENQLTPIAVYPEIYSGNPLNAEVCVRYMLNHEALLNGNRLNETEEDLFFWYSSQLIVKETDVDFLTMVGPDLEMFYDDGREKTTPLLYLNRVPDAAIDFTALPEAITVISVKQPRPLVELAEILKSASVMYTFEWSGTCNLAALCGVPVVSLIAPGYEKLAISDASIRDMGGAGVCFSDDELVLQKTRDELYKVREHMQKFEANFSAQLTHFFAKTQWAAELKNREKFVPLEKWIINYPVNKSPQIDESTVLSLTVIILHNGMEEDLDKTLLSLNPLKVDVVIYSPSRENIEGQDRENFNDWLKNTLKNNNNHWVLFLHSGDVVYNEIFSNLYLFRDKIAASLAFYSDRIVKDHNDNKEAFFLPDFDLDYFLATPERFSRGAFFRRELCLEIAAARELAVDNVEIDCLFQLANANLISDIMHIPLPLIELDTGSIGSSDKNMLLLAENLRVRGYDNAIIDTGKHGLFKVDYHAQRINKLTVVLIVDESIEWTKRTLSTFVDSVSNIDFEIILIDNFTDNTDIRSWLTSLNEINHDVFRIYFSDEKISAVSALNHAFSVARGDFILHLADGIYFENSLWLEALLSHCGRSDIFACAPVLIDKQKNHYSSALNDGKLTELCSVQGSKHPYEWDAAADLMIPKRASLLSAECIIMRTASCHKAGGLDEKFTDIQESINDLLLRTSGLQNLNLFVPQSRVSFENGLLGTKKTWGEGLFTEKWLEKLASDPCYNFNLVAGEQGAMRESNLSLLAARMGLEMHALFICDPNKYSEFERYDEISQLINRSNNATSTTLKKYLSLCDFYRIKPRNIVLSMSAAYANIALLKNKSGLSNTRFIIEVTGESLSVAKNAKYHMADILHYADTLVVRNSAALKQVNHKNAVLHADKLSQDWYRVALPERYQSGKRDRPRVGIVLAGLEPDDWKHLDVLIKEMSQEVSWIIYGACPDSWKPSIHEYHRKVPYGRLQQTLQSLNLDLALAPLSQNLSNQAEGHRVIIQLGACGYPTLASDHDAYQAIKSVKLIRNKTSQWRYMINKVINEPSYSRRLSEELYNEVNACWIYTAEERPVWLNN